MKMNLRKTLLIPAMLLISSSAFAGGTQIGSGSLNFKCSSEPFVFEEGRSMSFNLELATKNGKLGSILNGVSYNQDIVPQEYKIKNTSVDIETDEVDSLNEGEKRIVHMLTMLSEPTIAERLHISIDLHKISKVKLFEIQREASDKTGGVVLLEAYDAQDNLMGHLISSIIPAQCN